MRPICFFFFSIFALFLFGQVSDVDLLDSAYAENNPKKTLDILLSIESPKDFTDSLQSKYLLTKGIAYGKRGIEDSALFYLNRSIEISESQSFNYLITRAGNAKGLTLFHAGRYENAIQTYQEALMVAEENDFREEESTILGNMGGVYFQMDDYTAAIKYSQKSLDIAIEINDIDDIAYGNLRLAVVYEEIDSLELSILHNSKASKSAEKLKNYVLLTYIEKTLGNIHKKLDRLDSSLYHHKRARYFAELEGEQENIASTTIEIARVHLENGQFEMAESEALNNLAISNANSYPLQAKLAHDVLYQIALKRNDYKKALRERNEYLIINDSLNAVDTKERIAELEIKYETAKKEKEIIEANTEIERKERFQQFLYIIIATVVVFSTIGLLLLIQRFRLKKALLFQEINTLRVQINSIFGGETQKLDLTLDQINEGLFKPLSEREYEILNEAISDKTNSEIADTVFVSVNTVKTHLKNIYLKLGVSNRKEALEALLAKV
ncbi:MAG: tetratricopeptide repeat protein [Ekhidna sp.]